MATQTLPQVVPFPQPTRKEVAQDHIASVKARMTHLTPAELIAVLKVARSRSIRDWTMVLLAYRHGMRASEICDLRSAPGRGGPEIRVTLDPPTEGFAPHGSAALPSQRSAVAR